MRYWIPIVLLWAAGSAHAAGELERATRQFQKTQYREAIETLKPLASSPDGSVHELIGKAWFQMAEYKRAQEAFEKAVAAEPGRSSYYHWLGKAYGRRAEASNMLIAPILAGKARDNFEKAVELDGRNTEAMNDLFSYYLEAPGFLGGGVGKAEALAQKIQELDPVEYHYAAAQIALKRKQFDSAESHFRQAFRMAPKSVGRAIDLARFLSRQGRGQESDAVFDQAEQIAPNSPRVMFERASALVQAKRDLPVAKSLLQRYLQAPLTPDDPPRAEAERLLKRAVSLGA